MNETGTNPMETGPSATPAPSPEPARMGPLARYLNVFLSPGAVFEDVRRSPGGWWVPIFVGGILFAIFAGIHVAKYDQAQIAVDQVKASPFLKLAPQDAQEKVLDTTRKAVRLTPNWHSQLGYLGWGVLGSTLSVWLFTFLYLLLALMMGWVPDFRASKLFINFGSVAGILVAFIAGAAVINILGGPGGRGGAEVHAPADWSPVASFVLCLGVVAALFALTARSSRHLDYGRVFSAVAYGWAPGALALLVGVLIIFLRVPDATPMQEIVPSSLAALLDPKTSAKWLVSLASSLDLFSLWSMALTVIGLSKVLGRKTGAAATLVLIPWGLWVLLKVGWGLITG